jgi:hypothetical protein
MQTGYLLQQEEFAEPQPDIEAMLDRWDKAVQDFRRWGRPAVYRTRFLGHS